jgi:hypothetical protein
MLASMTEPAKAIGIQYAEKGQPLQIDARWTGKFTETSAKAHFYTA